MLLIVSLHDNVKKGFNVKLFLRVLIVFFPSKSLTPKWQNDVTLSLFVTRVRFRGEDRNAAALGFVAHVST